MLKPFKKNNLTKKNWTEKKDKINPSPHFLWTTKKRRKEKIIIP